MANDGTYVTLDLVTGQPIREQAIQISAGAADSGKITKLNALGELDESMLPNSEIQSKTAFETLTASDFIHVRSDGQIEKADATTSGKPASGFVRVGITAASADKTYGEGILGGFTGLTVGGAVFLGKTAGAVSQDVSSFTAGNVVQKLGVAWSATEVKVEIGIAYLLA